MSRSGRLVIIRNSGLSDIRMYLPPHRKQEDPRVAKLRILADDIHNIVKDRSLEPPHLYTEGKCDVASRFFQFNAWERFTPFIKKVRQIRGVEVPGSSGHIRQSDVTGLHHLALLEFEDEFLAVDVTIAQLYKGLPKYKNTKFLILVTEPDYSKLINQLEEVYRGGKWRVIDF